MKKSIKVVRENRGRPATGKHPHVTFRQSPEVTAEVDAWGKAEGVTRSEAFRRLVELGLKAKGSQK
jgi:hypothetical protein